MNTPLIAFMLLVVSLTTPVHAGSKAKALAAQTQYVQVDGGRIAYRAIGSGSPVVLANRLRGTIDTWDPAFLDKLAERHTVITFDYPGIGYSTGKMPDDIGQIARVINEFTVAIKLEKFTMLGWSWGGAAAQAVLLDQPGRVTHAVLIGANPPGRVEIPLQQEFLERAVKPFNDLADEEVLFFEPRSEFSRAAARASHDRIYSRPDVASKIPSKMEQFQVYFTAAAGFHEDKAGRRTKLTEIRTPVLVISGDHDISTAGQNWFPLIGQMRNAQFMFYSETGHAPHHQYPELSAEYIADFIALTPN
ncbi:alpha/beta hydrolase [Lysobacter daejeonensis GH1-9]|uniref:Alpha/beta hydrolase n=1 Tax=Lysobacter daejeonensis GH1-9 TaxID=1385517 RepID=A0A0A0F0X8_9GAMM|nr:alpha/beta hydrolase [Lysobacter daejeonensis]KGM56235.1 alpha/beta hydrolase [Lysobacter daejeonensis GH1-9]